MSIERLLRNCGYQETIRVNFGQNRSAEQAFHDAFKCPRCAQKEGEKKCNFSE